MNERLKELRKTLNMTLEKFGDHLGMGKSAISRMESGVSNITEQTIKSICREFNVHENWLRNGCGPMFEPEPQDEFAAFCKKYDVNELERCFLERYINLGERERKDVFNFITGWFSDMNETVVALESPAVVSATTTYPQEVFEEVENLPENMALEDMTEEDILRAGEEYMRELRMEKNRRARLGALEENA